MNNYKPWQSYPLISSQLSQVNDYLLKTIKAPIPSLQSALLTMANSGGKYLRPTILILSARSCGKKELANSPKIIKLATSIEILHMATLIHDDVIDDSDKRRGNISIQARFGKDVAVYAGDLLFTNFFDLMLETIDEHEFLVKNAQTMRRILNGELGQMGQRFNINQSFDDYLKDIKGKTAALFSLASEEGAHVAGGDFYQVQLMADFGQNLGIAFQMIDDILDYAGGKKLNKPTLEDLATGVYSLPILLALSHDNLRLRLDPILAKKREMTLEDIDQIQEIILSSNTIEESRAIAEQFSQKAVNNLKELPSNKAVKLLKKMSQELLSRTL